MQEGIQLYGGVHLQKFSPLHPLHSGRNSLRHANAKFKEHKAFLGTVLLVITLFPDLARNSSVEKTTITVITTLLARAFASEYNL